MNILCTLYISNKPLGTIVSVPRDTEDISTISKELSSKSTDSSVRFGNSDNILILVDKGSGSRINLQLMESKVVDEPLRKLSSNDYIVITDRVVMYHDKMYQFFETLPAQCMWKALPHMKIDEIIDYKPTCEVDELLVKEGYSKELKSASYILVPPDFDDFSAVCTPYDLLIKSIDGLSNRSPDKEISFNTYSGRKGTIPEPYNIDGRYIYLESTPKFEGACKYPPFTYNMNILISKYDIMQNRLNNYGRDKVESACSSMRSLCSRLSDVENQFMAASVYEDVVAIHEKAKKMN